MALYLPTAVPISVVNVQLLENASRAGDKTYLRGLKTCVDRDLRLPFMDQHHWLRNKTEVEAMMPVDVFSRRPLDPKAVSYCAGDVAHLPALRELYAGRLDGQWMQKALEESSRRVAEACGPAYEPQGESKKLGPWGSGLAKNVLSLDQLLEKLEQDRIDDMEEEMLGYGRYDDDEWYDDDRLKCRDVVSVEEWDNVWDSCWEK